MLAAHISCSFFNIWWKILNVNVKCARACEFLKILLGLCELQSLKTIRVAGNPCCSNSVETAQSSPPWVEMNPIMCSKVSEWRKHAWTPEAVAVLVLESLVAHCAMSCPHICLPGRHKKPLSFIHLPLPTLTASLLISTSPSLSLIWVIPWIKSKETFLSARLLDLIWSIYPRVFHTSYLKLL